MKIIKNRNIKYLLIVFVIVLILFLSIIKSKGNEQITNPFTYDFENNSILDLDQESNYNYYNMRNQTEYNKDYIGFENFDYNDISELSTQWSITDNGITTYAQITNDNDGHKNSLYHFDNSAIDLVSSEFVFLESHTYGQLEFWIYMAQGQAFLELIESGTDEIFLFFDNSPLEFDYYDGSYNYLQDYELNTWYHILIDFNTTKATFNVEINENTYSDLPFRNNPIEFNEMKFATSPALNGRFYIDSLDFSWSNNYFYHRNLLPRLEKSNSLEVDKYEFDYQTDFFENDLCSWYSSESGSGYDDISIIGSKDTDKYIDIYNEYGAIYTNQVDLNNLNSDSYVVNISIEMEISSITSQSFEHYVIIKTKNYNDIHDYIKFEFDDSNQDFLIWNATSESYENKFTYNQAEIYNIDIYFNVYDDILIYSIKSDTVNEKYYYEFDVDNDDLYGLDEFYLYTSCSETVDLSVFDLHYYSIGIYESGLSYIDNNDKYEFGLIYYKINDLWNSDNNNLLTIGINADYKLWCHNYYDYFRDGYILNERMNQTDIQLFNLADKFDNNNPKFIYNNPYIVFEVFHNCTIPSEIEIEGIKLIDQDDNYVYGNYYYNNSNPLDNWFYVIDNKLYYHFNNSENPYKETMRITFNIYDVLLTNNSLISYSSYITNNYSGYIYTDSYYSRETFNIINNDTVQNTYLNITNLEHFTLKEIVIELQTNNISNGLTNGYIQNINIYPTKPLFPDFEGIEYLQSTFLEKMIETIIPLIFFIVPSFLIKTRYGNKIVIPIWILLTFVFLLTDFIPFWICFIIFLGIGIMSLNREKDVFE